MKGGRPPGSLHDALEAARSSPDALIFTVAQRPFEITHVNAAWENLCGYSADEAVGKTCRILRGLDTSRESCDMLNAALDRRQGAAVRLLNYTKAGTPFINDLQVVPLSNDGGTRVTHFVGKLTPWRVPAERPEYPRAFETPVESVATQSARVRMPSTLAEAIAPTQEFAAVVTEREPPFRITHVNDAWCRLCGFTAAEARGNTLKILQGPDTCELTLAAIKQAALTSGRITVRLINFTKDKRPFANTLQVLPLRDHPHHLLGILRGQLLVDKRLPSELLRSATSDGAPCAGSAIADGAGVMSGGAMSGSAVRGGAMSGSAVSGGAMSGGVMSGGVQFRNEPTLGHMPMALYPNAELTQSLLQLLNAGVNASQQAAINHLFSQLPMPGVQGLMPPLLPTLLPTLLPPPAQALLQPMPPPPPKPPPQVRLHPPPQPSPIIPMAAAGAAALPHLHACAMASPPLPVVLPHAATPAEATLLPVAAHALQLPALPALPALPLPPPPVLPPTALEPQPAPGPVVPASGMPLLSAVAAASAPEACPAGSNMHRSDRIELHASSASGLPPFLTKLYALVSDPETDELVHWIKGSTAFRIVDPARFASDLLPRYFKHNKLGSFTQQMHTYAFVRRSYSEPDYPDAMVFSHEHFRPDAPEELHKIRRGPAGGRVEDLVEELTVVNTSYAPQPHNSPVAAAAQPPQPPQPLRAPPPLARLPMPSVPHEAGVQLPPTNASSDLGPVALLAPANDCQMAACSHAPAGRSTTAVAEGGGFVVPMELLEELLRQSEEAIGRMEQSFRHRALAMDHTLVALSQAVAHRHPALHAAVQEILNARPAPAVPAPRAAQDYENDMEDEDDMDCKDDDMGAHDKHSDGEENDCTYAIGGSAQGSQPGGAAAGASARGSSAFGCGSGRPTLDHLTAAVSLTDAGLLPDEAVAKIDLKRKRDTSPEGSREGEERDSEPSERSSYDNNDHSSIEGRDGSDRERTGADSGSEDDRRKQCRGESDERSDSAGRSSHKSGSDKSGSDNSGASGGSQPSNASGNGSHHSDQSGSNAGSNADSNAGSGSASDVSRASAVAGSVGSAGANSSDSNNLSSSSALPQSEPSTAGSGSTSGSSP